MPYRPPYKPPQVPPVDGMPFDPDNLAQNVTLPPQPGWVAREQAARQGYLEADRRVQDIFAQQAQLDEGPKGIEGLISSPIFQLAVPTALSALSAIYPRTMGPAAGIGMAGFRTVSDTVASNQQMQRTNVSAKIKQMLDDRNKEGLRYTIGKMRTIPGADPMTLDTLEQGTNLAPENTVFAANRYAQELAQQQAGQARLAELQANPPGPGVSESVQLPTGTVNVNPIEPKEPKPVSLPNTVDEAWLVGFREKNKREPNEKELAGWLKTKARMNDTDVSGMSPGMLSAISARSGRFSGEKIVEETQMMAAQVEFINSLDPNANDPSSDQGLIRAFAKVTDPTTGVREEEYKTIERYAQSWKDRFGFNVRRILENTEFLTPAAREQIKDVIRKKYAAHLKQYTGIKKSYVNQINILGKTNQGHLYLTDYESTFPSPETSKTFVDPTRQLKSKSGRPITPVE